MPEFFNNLVIVTLCSKFMNALEIQDQTKVLDALLHLKLKFKKKEVIGESGRFGQECFS